MSSVFKVANRFINLAKEDKNYTLDFLKLQKLCFIAYGRYLAKTNTKLFTETIEAWRFGPVIPKLYHAIDENNLEDPNKKNFINLNALFPTTESLESSNSKGLFNKLIKVITTASLTQSPEENGNSSLDNIINKTWTDYFDLSGLDLVELTHEEGTPWQKSYTGEFGNIIPDEYIYEYYSKESQNI